MATVIPRLVESLHKRKVDPVISISELLLSFVAAYKDMPLQRRQDIFISLSSRIGAEEFLFALLVLLVNKYPDDGSVVDFATRLTAQQDCNTQLSVSSMQKPDDDSLIGHRRLKSISMFCSMREVQSLRCHCIYWMHLMSLSRTCCLYLHQSLERTT